MMTDRTSFAAFPLARVVFCAALLLVAALAPMGVFAAGPNLVANPGLETGSGGAPNGWTAISWGTPSATFTYPAGGHTGRGATVALSADSTGDARWQHTAVNVSAGVYEYSTWYLSNVESEIDIVYTHTDGSTSYDWVTTLPSSGGAWQQASALITVPSGVTKMSVFHLIYNQGSLSIDDTSVARRDGDTTPPPSNAFAEGMVTLSFDDGWFSQYEHALPILNAAGIKGTFFVTAEPVWSDWDGFMNASNVGAIAQAGHEIGGHTITHSDLTTLDATTLDQEITWGESYFEGITGKAVVSIAYPYGAVNNTVINAIKNLIPSERHAGGRLAGDSHDLNFRTVDPYLLDSFSPVVTTSVAEMKAAIDTAKAEKGWYIISLHEVNTSGNEYSMTPANLQELVDYIKTSGIKTVTISQGTAMLQ